MKNLIILSLLALTVQSFAFAAPRAARATRTNSERSDYRPSSRSSSEANLLGFQFGPAIATASMSVKEGEIPKSDSRTRLAIGAFYEHPLSANFVFRPEFDYVQRGFTMKKDIPLQGGGAVSTTTDFSANYFELPMMFKGQLPLSGFTPYFMTGPFIGCMIGKSATTNVAATETTKAREVETSLDNKVNSFNFGWNFGAGSRISLTREISLDAGLRYSMGLTNISSEAGDSTKLSSFQILAGVAMAI